jgi:CTP:molybdopterin cytidylyltransferase MocA
MIVGVLLAAGASTRMGSPKPLVTTRGGSFLSRGVRHLWSACDQVVVVLGSNAKRIRESVELEFAHLVESGELHDELQRAHRHGADGLEVHFVENPDWRKGMYASVRLGLKEAMRAKPEAVLLLPVDHPIVKPRTVAALSEMIRAAIGACAVKERGTFAYALVPRYRKHRGHPVALSPALALAVAKDGTSDNLSDAIRSHARLVGYLDVLDAGVVRNVNRRGD